VLQLHEHSQEAGSIRALCRYTERRINTFDAVRSVLLNVLQRFDTKCTGKVALSILGCVCMCSIEVVKELRNALEGNQCMIAMCCARVQPALLVMLALVLAVDND
jgi:hypothetical protein